MVFNSYTFVVFFVVVLILHRLPLSWTTKKINLLLASYLFYAAWNPPFILLLWLSTVVDYFVGKALYTQQNPVKKKMLLVVSLIGNLGMLCFFKYGTFLLENFTALINLVGVNFHPAKPNIILPAGISFYTFTTLCYTIDMYHKKSEPVKKLLDFSLFVTFFPHLVAGPIVRPHQLVPQFEQEQKASNKQLLDGLLLLSLGLFMKVVLADGMLAAPANSMFSAVQPLSSLDAWAGVLAFSGQIFFDFSGYSTCAIGVALCLGFILPQNFNYPYGAIGFSDFWRRWHITLSLWLRDYLYIPLGGNRNGKVSTYVNLMLTMLIGGLWHGASWTFVVWGGLHGLYLWIEKWYDDKTGSISFLNTAEKPGIPGFVYALITFMLVNVTWVFFRADGFVKAWSVLKSMFGLQHGNALLTSLDLIKVAVILPVTVCCHWSMRQRKVLDVAYRLPWWTVGTAWALMIIFLIWCQESSSSFIYFQF